MADKRISLRKARGGPKIEPPPRDLKAEAIGKVKAAATKSLLSARRFLNGGSNPPENNPDPAFDPHSAAALLTLSTSTTAQTTMQRIMEERRQQRLREQVMDRARSTVPPTMALNPDDLWNSPSGPAQSSLVNVPAHALREQERRNMRDPDRVRATERPVEVNMEQDIRSREYLLVMRLNPNFMNMQRIPDVQLLDIRGAWDSDTQRASLANDIADRMTRELTDSVRQQIFELLRDRVGPGRR